jgi:hypothetical protein
MVLLRREGNGWVWDFRKVLGSRILPRRIFPVPFGTFEVKAPDNPGDEEAG